MASFETVETEAVVGTKAAVRLLRGKVYKLWRQKDVQIRPNYLPSQLQISQRKAIWCTHEFGDLGDGVGVASHSRGDRSAKLLFPYNCYATAKRGISQSTKRFITSNQAHKPTVILLTSVYSSKASLPPSLPIPESLIPPNGCSHADINPTLTPTIPLCSASATVHNRLISSV